MNRRILLFLCVSLLAFSCEKDKDESVDVVTLPVREIVFNPATDKTEATVRGAVNGNAGAVRERGFIWSKGNKFDLVKTPVPMDGEFSLDFADLEKNAIYYVKAYALTNGGTRYGEMLPFTASSLPLVADDTDYENSLTGTTLLAEGQVVSNGGVSVSGYGVYVGPKENPTERRIKGEGIDDAGRFTVDIRSLTPSTGYILTFYAVNSQGENLSEGIPFTTKSLTAPSVVLDADTPFPTVTPTQVSVKARLVSDGGDPDAEFGVRYGTSASSLTTTVKGAQSDENGGFTIDIPGLTPKTDYYFAVYAKNAKEEAVTVAVLQATPDITKPLVENSAIVAGVDYFDNAVTLRGKVVSNGGLDISEYGFYFGTEADPTASVRATDLDADGKFSVTLTAAADGLTPLTAYHYRAYAKNSLGESENTTARVSTGIADTRTVDAGMEVELYVRDAAMAKTTRRLAYWTLDPIDVDLNGDGTGDTRLIFLDRNLGATETPKSAALNINAVGSFFKWGSYEVQASSQMAWLVVDPASSLKTIPSKGGVQWNGWGLRAESTVTPLPGNKTWTALSGQTPPLATNPCPEGFRVPTRAEWLAAFAAKGVTGMDGLFTHFGFCVTGDFTITGGYESGTACRFWTDTGDDSNAKNPAAEFINSDGPAKVTETTGRKRAMVVRCVKSTPMP